MLILSLYQKYQLLKLRWEFGDSSDTVSHYKTFYKFCLPTITFSQWSALCSITFKDLYIDNVFASLQQLLEKFVLPRHNFLGICRLPVLFTICTLSFLVSLVLPLLSPSSNLFILWRVWFHIFYNAIWTLHDCPLASIKSQWEEDLRENFPQEQWKRILRHMQSSSFCARHGLIQCKILRHTHSTKSDFPKYIPKWTPCVTAVTRPLQLPCICFGPVHLYTNNGPRSLKCYLKFSKLLFNLGTRSQTLDRPK